MLAHLSAHIELKCVTRGLLRRQGEEAGRLDLHVHNVLNVQCEEVLKQHFRVDFVVVYDGLSGGVALIAEDEDVSFLCVNLVASVFISLGALLLPLDAYADSRYYGSEV